MSKKNKIILSVTAIVLIIAIIVTAIILLKPEGPLTAEKLFKENQKYFDSLTSLETEILVYYDYGLTEDTSVSNSKLNTTMNVQTHFLSGTSYIKQNFDGQQNENIFNETRTLYTVNDGDSKKEYYRETYDTVEFAWRTNKIDEVCQRLSLSKDFELVAEFANNFTLKDNVVEIDGVRCYETTATIFKPEYISRNYDVGNLIGVFADSFLEHSIPVTVYFREDTHMIYKIIYDFTELQHKIFELQNEAKMDYGSLIVTINFKGMNTFEEITVPEDIKSVAGPYYGDEIQDPISIDLSHYELTGAINMKIGDKARDYLDKYTIEQYAYELDYNAEPVNGQLPQIITDTFNKGELGYLQFTDANGNFFKVWVSNPTDEPLHFLDCNIVKVDIAEYNNTNFYSLNIGKSLTTNSTFEDCKNVLGRYTSKFDNGRHIEYQWRSHIDYCEVLIKINKETGKIEELQLYVWDLNNFFNAQ